MIAIPGYHITEALYESTNSLIYRGLRETDRQPIVLKVLKQYLSPERVAWYKREYEIARDLRLPGVIQAYALEQTQQLVMILEDGGESLARLNSAGQLTVEQFLKLAVAITQVLGQIHAANIIHKDINPSNIVVNSKTGQVKIIDFGISTVLSKESQPFKNPNVLEGTIAYISPEQTGRMNRVIDYRSDFYSLGVTFYELLTGEKPFSGDDVLALVHCHIAKQPLPPHELLAMQGIELPSVLSDILMKLMAKNAEDRYQSAHGIQADLEECLSQLHTGQIHPFLLGRRDVSNQFSIPQKLYGRESQVRMLLEAFERVAGSSQFSVSSKLEDPTQNSRSELILVSGYSGAGKSALVNEVHKPITARKGNFISGKYDQYQRNIPYYALSQAFNNLCDQLLTESEAVLKQWQEKILAAVGSNGQVLIEVIPNLGLVIGKQPPVAQVGVQEAQNRFNLVFQNFIKAICQPDHPLVVFIDDLQWADSASLNLLKLIMGDRDIRYLLIVGAYRDNEVDAAHPLMMTVADIQKEGGAGSEIHVSNLTPGDVNALIAETLTCPPSVSQALTDLIYDKTQGNAFFTTEFFKSLYTEGLLAFNHVERVWHWDIEQIQAKGVTSNVVELMVGKITNLAAETQHLLPLAACIGNQFDLATLGIISERSPQQCLARLLPALQESLIVPLNHRYKLVATDDAADARFKFQHDRVQQAAYSLIPEEQKQTIHLKIGRLLLSHTSPQEQVEKIFETINQLNIGARLISDLFEREQLARLNLIAGCKAKESTAYRAAAGYFTTGIELLDADSWEQQYLLTFEIHQQLGEVKYLNGEFEQSEALINLALAKSKSHLDRAKLYNLLIVQYTLRAKYSEAIEVGRTALSILGVELPEENLKTTLESELTQAKHNLGEREIASLLHVPEMSIAEKKIALKVLKNIDPPAYFVDLSLYSLVVVKSVNLSLQYGNAPESPKGYSTYGLLLGSVLGEYQSGYQFGLLALKVSEKFQNLSQKCQVFVIVGCFLNHWVNSLKLANPVIDEGYCVGVECGDLQFAGYSLLFKILHLFHQGVNLEALLADIPTSLRFSQQTKNQWAVDAIVGCQIVSMNLSGLTENKTEFNNGEIDEQQYLADCQTHGSFSWICTYQILKSEVLYLYGEFRTALEAAKEAEKYLDFILGHFSVAKYNFLTSLNLLALYSGAATEQNHYLNQLLSNQKQMKTWAEHCPANFQHKYHLVQAEICRITGKRDDAIALYDRAITGAKENGYLQEEALANELAAKFYLDWGKERIAQAYMLESYDCYVRWGAKAKVKDLEQRYPQLVQTRRQTQPGVQTTVTAARGSLSTTLDLTSVLKASQTLGREIKLSALLAKLIEIVMENAGAETGYLILQKEGQWCIEAAKTVTSDATVFRSLPLANHLPTSILNYVIRTQETLVFDDCQDIQNLNDPYLQEQQPKSVLCSPLLNQGKLIGILYLENNLTPGAFTSERVELLNLLSSQAAISIENATLYNTLEQKVADRTQELSQALEDLKATQRQLVESEKMASLGSLVAGIAHEINTPVGTSITIASTLADETQNFVKTIAQGNLKRSLLQNYVGTIQECTQLVLNNLQRAGELIQSFKQVAVDRTNLDQRTFALKPYIEEILVSLAPKLKHTSHTLRVEGDDTVILESYPGAIAQIVTNLVVNSLTHAFQLGEAGHLCFTIQHQADRVIIQYQDNGCGIPAEHLNKIFEPFFTTARNRGGTGLGLHIVYNLVTQKLRGTINVQSEVGRTLFTLALPLVVNP